MNQMNPRAQYLRTRVMTASPGELLVMLYDGLLQRIRQSKICFQDGNWAKAGELLGNAQDILSELMGSLKREHAPQLVDNLFNLYDYSKRRLIEALGTKSEEMLDEIHDLLKPLRDAWAEANLKLRTEQPSAVNG
jgi:flagellar protein FliS